MFPRNLPPLGCRHHIVSNIDFAETFLDAAGAPVPSDMQGRSLVPVLQGKTPDDWRTSFYYHFYEDNDLDHRVARHEGVTTGKTKLINFYRLGEWELYDLAKDPHELNNVYGKSEYALVQTGMMAELDRQRKALDVPPNDLTKPEDRPQKAAKR